MGRHRVPLDGFITTTQRKRRHSCTDRDERALTLHVSVHLSHLCAFFSDLSTFTPLSQTSAHLFHDISVRLTDKITPPAEQISFCSFMFPDSSLSSHTAADLLHARLPQYCSYGPILCSRGPLFYNLVFPPRSNIFTPAPSRDR